MASPIDRERISLFFSLLLERYAELRALEAAAPRPKTVEAKALLQAEEAAPSADVDASRELLDDVITLFGLGDLDGGLVSFERLLFLHPDSPRVAAFVKKYQEKILKLYEDVYTKDDVVLEFGPQARNPKLAFYEKYSPLKTIRELVRTSDDGHVSSVLQASSFGTLRTLALVNFLTRPGVLKIAR
jgi:hypothetical protein